MLFVIIGLLLLQVMSGLARPARGTPGVTVTLRSEARVQFTDLMLQDIADLEGNDKGVLGELARLALGPAPGIGRVLSFSREQILQLIRGVSPGMDVDITGAPLVQVTLLTRQVKPDDVVPVVRAYLAEAIPWQESEIAIRSIGNLNGIELPVRDLAFRILQKTAPSSLRNMLLPVEASTAGKPIKTFWIIADGRIQAEVLHAAKKLPFGKSVSSEDVRVALAEISDPRPGYLRNPDDAVGKVLRRALSPGDPLTRESLQDPFLVRFGQTVSLKVATYGVRIVTLARAEQNGRLGQVIRVRNLDSARSLRAQVTGRGEVKVD